MLHKQDEYSSQGDYAVYKPGNFYLFRIYPEFEPLYLQPHITNSRIAPSMSRAMINMGTIGFERWAIEDVMNGFE